MSSVTTLPELPKSGSLPLPPPSVTSSTKEAVSTLQKVVHTLKVIASVILFLSGITALACWSFGVVSAILPAVVLLVIMVVSYAIVILSIRDSFPAKTAREIQKQVEHFQEENVRFGLENSRLHEEVETLLETNRDLTQQVQLLSNLQTQLHLFGSRLAVHTGDFRDLIDDFKLNLGDFKDFGGKITETVASFDQMLASLRGILSQEGVQEITASVSSLRLQTIELESIVSSAQETLNAVKEETEKKKEQVKFLEQKQQELEAACERLSATIQILEITAQKVCSNVKVEAEASTSTTTQPDETEPSTKGIEGTEELSGSLETSAEGTTSEEATTSETTTEGAAGSEVETSSEVTVTKGTSGSRGMDKDGEDKSTEEESTREIE